jgi:predicted nucleic acid-binding protein
MRLVVADTGPLNYLLLIDAIDLLPKLFEKVFVPNSVHRELIHSAAPEVVRVWAAQAPRWLEIRPDPELGSNDPAYIALDDGERAAIALAAAISADLILMDDRSGVAVAYRRGIAVTGTLGVLDLAARRGLVDLSSAFGRLKATNFRYSPEIMEALLRLHSEQKK